MHHMLGNSVETSEQGLVGLAIGQELVPHTLPTIITASGTDHVLEQEQEQEVEVEPQGVAPDDDWTDVFTLLCGEDEGH